MVALKIDWRRVKLRNSLRLGEDNDCTNYTQIDPTHRHGHIDGRLVAAWQVPFELDGDESLHAAISIRLAGPPTHQEAQQKALKILHCALLTRQDKTTGARACEHGHEKSDSVIVAVKPANKAERSAAELVEPRAETKGNAGWQSTLRTQSRACGSQALARPEHIRFQSL
jgi:hypothetical protein